MITEFPLCVFTTLGGLAAGAYAASAFSPIGKEGRAKACLLPLMCLVLLAISAVALLFHLGHPERALNAFANPRAGIAQEGFASVLFGAVVVTDLALTWKKGSSPRALRWVGAVCAALLMGAMALAYCALKGVPAWGALPTIPFFAFGDLAMGAMLIAMLVEKNKVENISRAAVVLGILAVGAVAWETVYFANLGLGVGLLVSGGVLVALATLASAAASRKRTSALLIASFVLVMAGVALARYGYYAAL